MFDKICKIIIIVLLAIVTFCVVDCYMFILSCYDSLLSVLDAMYG